MTAPAAKPAMEHAEPALEDKKNNQALATALSWGEILWITKQKPVVGAVASLHVNPDDRLLPLFLIPSRPQLSTDYLALAEMTDPRQPLFTVYLPSARRTAEGETSVEALAEFYAAEIDRFRPEGPLALGGWSAGAPFSAAIAQCLTGRGRDVRLLVMIDGAPPALPLPAASLVEKIKILGHAVAGFGADVADLGTSLVRHVRFRPKGYSLSRAFNSAWQNSVIRLDCAVAGTVLKSRLGMKVPEESRVRPAEIAKTIKSLPPVHRSYCMKLYDAACAYRPRQASARSVLVFEATKEPDRSLNSVARKWASIARDVKTVTIKGSHMSIVRPPDGLPLARELCHALREASRDIR
ncbi:MAG TPA: thioesterase domain-containing protein [Rhizomicrobium sp.]|nr:thioesterase domain-containing protein [Rhizomicrobium sp.]